MRQPSILDVVDAVKRTEPDHAGVRAWWYRPPQRLPIRGAADTLPPRFEVVVETATGESADYRRIASELAAALRIPEVHVREYLGPDESQPLFRLMSGRAAAVGTTEVP
jgi:hypothetical protein